MEHLAAFLALELRSQVDQVDLLHNENDVYVRRIVELQLQLDIANRYARRYHAIKRACTDYMTDSDQSTIDALMGYLLDAELVEQTDVMEDFREFMTDDSGTETEYVPSSPGVIDLTASDDDFLEDW